jgi:MFS family permease
MSVWTALGHPTFRCVFAGAFVSQLGSWMQSIVLFAFAYDITHSTTFVGVVVFAQLGPLLFFSVLGGMIADRIDRRRLLIAVSIFQALASLALAAVVRSGDPSKVVLVSVVFALGLGEAVYAPTYAALLPMLVSGRDLPGAISLNSVALNGSRVVGPVAGAALYASWGADIVFILNAVSYGFVVASLAWVSLPSLTGAGERGSFARLVGGLRVARTDPIVRRCLTTIAMLSLFSLAFVNQLPAVADRNLGIAARSTEYGVLYACFGVGALLGSLMMGTLFARLSTERLVPGWLVAFAAALAIFAFVRTPGLAYPAILVVGATYFGVVTALMIVLQTALEDTARGRVMALWIMAFHGMVPIGNLIAGPVIEATSVTAVMVAGAVVAAALAGHANFPRARGRSATDYRLLSEEATTGIP